MSPVLAPSNDTLLIDDATRAEAASLVRQVGDREMERVVVVIDGESREIPKSVSDLLVHVLKQAAHGGGLTVRSMPDELTTTVAADMIGVSRPTLMKMIGRGEIPAHDVGTHKRLKTRDVIGFRTQRRQAQSEAFSALRSIDV